MSFWSASLFFLQKIFVNDNILFSIFTPLKQNIYDPKNGNTYSCTIKMLNPNTLEVRGYIGVSLIGRTDTWTKQVAK
jgi:hypothetical protein